MPKLTFLRTMLEVRDVAETIDYYARLGFRCADTYSPHEGEPPVWCQMERDGIRLMFNRMHTHEEGQEEPGHEHSHEPVMTGCVYLNADDVDGLWQELHGKDLAIEWEPQDFPHGMREFAVRDVNGYLIIFGMPTS